MSSSAHRSFPTGMVALLGLGLIGIGLWYFAALQPVAVKAIPPTARADPGEARTLGRMERFDLPDSAAAPAEEASTPPPPDAGRWEEDVARYEAVGREAPPAAGAVVLLGQVTAPA